jgi:hypothetical protein
MKDSSNSNAFVPHRGSLGVRLDHGMESSYVIEIQVEEKSEDALHELVYDRHDFEFGQKLFAILDTESRGLVDRKAVKDFATLRCPVFLRRDDGLGGASRGNIRHATTAAVDSPTFDEIWCSVVNSTKLQSGESVPDARQDCELGIEGLLVFCRFVALAQYLEAKRRFSARHLQQTMRHRNAPRGSELVVVDVPPPKPPAPLSPIQLAHYERKNGAPLPLPELDLDHSLVAAHDSNRRNQVTKNHGSVKVSLFNPSFSSHHGPSAAAISSSSSTYSNGALDFALAYSRKSIMEPSLPVEDIVVRRSIEDLRWLDHTFASHKVLGGTLCGRILPPFPGGSQSSILASHFQKEDSVIHSSIKTTGGAITTGVGRLREAAKSFFGSYYLNTATPGQLARGEEAPAPVPMSRKSPHNNNKRRVPIAAFLSQRTTTIQTHRCARHDNSSDT